MSNKKKKLILIDKVMITKDEVEEAFSNLLDEYGPSIHLWTTERQTQEISNYWLDRGKEDMSILEQIEEDV